MEKLVQDSAKFPEMEVEYDEEMEVEYDEGMEAEYDEEMLFNRDSVHFRMILPETVSISDKLLNIFMLFYYCFCCHK